MTSKCACVGEFMKRVHPGGHAFARLRMVKRMSGSPALASSGQGGRLLRRRRHVSETWT